jgi:hypothetical protein
MNLSESYKNRLQNLSGISESKKKKKVKESEEIHLPELTMDKKYLIKYLKDLYNIELKDE